MYMVYVPVPDRSSGHAISKAVTTESLAACTNLIGPVTSSFVWKGKLTKEKEFILVCKTIGKRVADLEKRIASLHPYECPCIARIRLDAVNRKYLDWVMTSVS